MITGYQLSVLEALTLLVGLLMASAGVGKKVLAWKNLPPRCSTCGQRRRYDCPCRR